MKWSVLGKLITRALPLVIELAENNSGVNKKELALKYLHNEIHELEPELANHPKVIDAVNKATDALVLVQNVVAHVKTELDAQAKL